MLDAGAALAHGHVEKPIVCAADAAAVPEGALRVRHESGCNCSCGIKEDPFGAWTRTAVDFYVLGAADALVALGGTTSFVGAANERNFGYQPSVNLGISLKTTMGRWGWRSSLRAVEDAWVACTT